MNNSVTAATKNCFSQPDIIKQLIYKYKQAFMCLIPSPITLPGLCDNVKLLLHKVFFKKILHFDRWDFFSISVKCKSHEIRLTSKQFKGKAKESFKSSCFTLS